MRFEEHSFGSIRIDGVTYSHDLIIDRGKIRKRKKAAAVKRHYKRIRSQQLPPKLF